MNNSNINNIYPIKLNRIRDIQEIKDINLKRVKRKNINYN